MKNLFCLPGLLLLVFLLPMTPLFSQRYPVQVSTMISPPYSLNLAEYVESGYDRIQVTVNALDMNVSNYRVKLKLVIESFDGRIRIETLPGFLPPPIFLNGGMPEILGSYDVTQHFNINNLSFRGLSKSQYLAEGHLPEGYYRIGFVAMDYGHAAIGSNVQVSNYGFSMAGLFLSDPPLLNLPGDDQKITASGIQNIVFQWTPRHRGSPNSAFSATYIFRLFEVWGPYSNPDVVASTQAPIFEAETGQNRYVYGIADPMLVPGRDYVWQVQVKEPGERDLFRNHGFSEAWMFRYGDECKVPSGLTAAAVNGPGLELAWESAPAHSDYVVQYRPLGTGTSWAVENTLTGSIRLYNVSGGTDYEVQVMANCGTFSSGFCERLTITLPEETKRFQCNTEPVLPEITNYEPLPALTPRSMFTAGGFDCRVVESSGSNGIFSGECLVIVPYYGYAQVLHTFKDIHINTDRVMTSGKLVAVVDSARAGAFRSALEDQPWGGGTSSGLTNEQLLLLFNAYEAITTEEEIENIHTGGTDGPLIITCSDGSTQENNYPAQYPIIVSDGQGNQYLVDEGGEATLITPDMVAAAEAERGAGTTAQAVSNVDSVIALLSPVHFAPAEGMKFGYDSLKYEGLTNQYDPQQILDNSVRVPFKAVASGQTDFLKALLPANEHMNDSAISFVYNGTPVTGAETGDGNKTLTLSALSTGTSMPLEVYYNLLDTAGNAHQELIGQVNLVGYERQEIKLVIVPVKILRPDNNNIEAPVVDEASIITHLNDKVYSQAVTSWNITTHEVLEVETEGAFDNDDPDNRMDYTGGMKDVYREFKDQFDRDNDAVYVFLIPGETEDGGLKGYMPLKGQYAFIFMNNIGTGTVENTIAHEIAHGTFNLRHTFSTENAYVLPENSTDNLMDYREGSELSKFQWDFIHNPESVLFAWLEDEEEGEMKKLKGKYTVYVGDSIMTEKKVFINTNKAEKIYVKYEPAAGDTGTYINAKLIYRPVWSKKDVSWPATTWGKINVNTKTYFGLDSLPEGKYTVLLKNRDDKVDTVNFYLRPKKYDFACSVCGRDLSITKEKLDLIFPNGENITPTLAGYFNTALKKAGFNTCKSHAHFFAQSYVETNGYTQLAENPNYRYEGVLELHNQKNDAKLFFNQGFFDNNTHLDYFHFKVYKNLSDSTGNYTGQNYKTFKWKSSTTDTVRVPTGGDAAYKFTKGKGTFNKVDFTKSEKISRNTQLLSIIYANSYENGAPATQDGYNYRGQGAMHLTWRENYRRVIPFAKELFNEDFDWVNHPEYLVNKEKDAVYSAVAYFYMRLNKDINKLNGWDINKVSYNVNGGYIGLDKRKEQFTRLSTEVFNLSDCKK